MEDGRRWAMETFGANGVHIRNLVPELVREEHTASADAQDASGHRSHGVYGEFWRGILEKFEQFGRLPGATLIRPGLAPYSIPVINGVALFPWRYARSKKGELATTPFVTSDSRAAMFDLPRVAIQPELNLGLPRPELTDEERELLSVIDAASKASVVTASSLVVVAICSSPTGLHDTSWGGVEVTNDGSVAWKGFHESLLHLPAVNLQSVPTRSQTFTSGQPPAKRLDVAGDDISAGDSGDV